MSEKKSMATRVMFVLALGLFVAVGTASAQDGAMTAADGTVFADGFDLPQGVLVAEDGSVWVIEAGSGGDEEVEYVDFTTLEPATAMIGQTADVVHVSDDGTKTVVTTLKSLEAGDTVGGARLALLGDDLFATSGHWIEGVEPEAGPVPAAVIKIEDGEVIEVAETWPLERDENPDGAIVESHPYGIAAGPDGLLWVADAAANDLLRVDPESGEVELVAVFDAIPGVFPNPHRDGDSLADPVPTGLTFDDDGNAYVSFLSGAPFVPGSAKVMKVTPDGDATDYATGLTMLTDLRTGPDGELYAVQVGTFTEEGPVPDSGNVLRIKEGDGTSEVVIEGLTFPTSVDFDDEGNAYVTVNGGFSPPGSGAVVVFADLASAAEPVTIDVAAATTPDEMPETGFGDGPIDILVLALVALGLLGLGGAIAERRARATG